MIIKIIILWIVLQIIMGVIYGVIRFRKEERAKIEFANKPKEELLAIALQQVNLAETYYSFCRHMSNEKAADFVINKMLIDLRIIGYRKEEEES